MNQHEPEERGAAAADENECGDPPGEQAKELTWQDKMQTLEEIHYEIGPQLMAIQEALEDGVAGFESDWQEEKGSGYEEYRQAEIH